VINLPPSSGDVHALVKARAIHSGSKSEVCGCLTTKHPIKSSLD
jgi:hypothetical protein